MTSRQAMMAVALCSAAFCGSALFLWAVPAAAGPGKGVVGPQVTAPPGGTATYVFSVDPRTRNALARAYAVPDGVTVELNCPVGPAGESCSLGDPGPVDIPATISVPPSLRPGTEIQVTEVESDRSGTTTQGAVVEVASPLGPPHSPSPAPTGSSNPQPTPTGTPTTNPTGTGAPTPNPTGTGAPTPNPTGTGAPTPKPTGKPSPKPTHKRSPKPTHKPKPGHSSAPPAGTTHHPRPVHIHLPAPVGGGHGGPPGNGQIPASAVPLPPVVPPGPVALPPGAGQAQPGPPNGGQVALPPADRPAPAPILPTVHPGHAAQPQPSPMPLPRVTGSPGTQPGASRQQTVNLPNRTAASSSQAPNTFDLVEAQIIGFFLVLAAAMAALLRPVRARVNRAKGKRPAGGRNAAGGGPESRPPS